MIIGIPKEIKSNENRVAIVPSGVKAFVQSGHNVIVETRAGIGVVFRMRTMRLPGRKSHPRPRRFLIAQK